ncbi:MAG TPA: chromosomal replication initiator protein DnaA [Solirubrobacteraceae bacterium]
MPAWRTIRTELRRLVGETTYDIWIAPIEVQGWDGELLLLKAPAGTQGWVSDRFGRVLERCARQILGASTRIAFDGPKASATRTAERALAPAQSVTGAAFNPRYSFDQFIIGQGNRLAHAAALAVAEHPGQAYNPLFLHAPPGLGKTHLLHAIGNFVNAFSAGATVRYTTAEAFTNHFVTALNAKALEPFKRAYRDADVLLIDDVQFLASKAKTEEEFFHTFNALYERGRQLVLTCDRLPRALVSVQERLRERFEAGLVADIKTPDQPTRVTILRKRAQLDQIRIEDDAVLELIAERVTDNVRALEGALIRVVAHHSLTQRPIDVALATEVMDVMYPAGGSTSLSIEAIQTAVADYYALTPEELVSPSRAARIAWPRQIAIHLARDLSTASLQAIGSAFGGRNHATVLHACKRVSERLHNDQQAVDQIAQIHAQLRGRQADRDY